MDFVNRSRELAVLSAYLRRGPKPGPAIVILRSPTGFGKSSLTDQLCHTCQIPGLVFCTIEPEIQGSAGAIRLHDGFFIQRCAEHLSTMAESSGVPWPSFRAFLRSRQWQTIKEKSAMDFIAEMPSWKSVYKIVLDYTSRVFSIGHFSPHLLLRSDRNDAVRICEEYVESVLNANTVVLIMREMQHCDSKSFRALLRLNQSSPRLDLIIEYTSQTGEFEPGHQKLLHRLTGPATDFHILDLVRLEAGHLEHLIRTKVSPDFAIASDVYAAWNGNLRSIIEMQFQITIARKITSPKQIDHVLCDLPSMLEEHIGSLPSLHRMVLAVCAANVEAIGARTLTQAMTAIAPPTSPRALHTAIEELVETHKFLVWQEGVYRIHNETVADVLRKLPMIRALSAIAEKALRDHYSRLVSTTDFEDVGMAAAVRQVFRLCAHTKDVAGLLRATEALSTEILLAQDQSLYVEIVAAAITADPDLYGKSHGELVEWAASLAYDIGDYAQSAKLLSLLRSTSMTCQLMYACTLLEIGRHDEALQCAAQWRMHATTLNQLLVADLIEGIAMGCLGDHQRARLRLTAIIGDIRHADSPVLGYAYRFFEVVEDYAGCIDQLNRSIACFDRAGLLKSKAYSQAALAVLIARIGDIVQARQMIADAAQALGDTVRDRHLVLNNMAAIELLAEQPDAASCVQLLKEALRHVRDDYSEITVLSNLSLAYLEAKEPDFAVECTEKALQILDDHDFADQEIVWPVCFNAARVMSIAGYHERADTLLARPITSGLLPKLNRNYWDYRYGRQASLDEQYCYLAARGHHPLYLSHWLLDLDGLKLLSTEPQQ